MTFSKIILVLQSLILCQLLGCNMSQYVGGNADYFDGDGAQIAAEKIRQKIGRPFNVSEIVIERDEFCMRLQNPEKPEELIEYRIVAGHVSEPFPFEQNTKLNDLQSTSVQFEKIDFSLIPALAAVAVEKSGIKHGMISRVTFETACAARLGNGCWLIEVEGEKKSIYVTADSSGNFLGIDSTTGLNSGW